MWQYQLSVVSFVVSNVHLEEEPLHWGQLRPLHVFVLKHPNTNLKVVIHYLPGEFWNPFNALLYFSLTTTSFLLLVWFTHSL